MAYKTWDELSEEIRKNKGKKKQPRDDSFYEEGFGWGYRGA